MGNRAGKRTSLAPPQVPVSWGELVDKLTILEIKSERMAGKAALANVRKERKLLAAIAAPVLAGDVALRKLAARLKGLNETLWEIEERIRAKEDLARFDKEFIALARSVYKRNDQRGALKRQINLRLKSGLMEEKSYKRAGGKKK